MIARLWQDVSHDAHLWPRLLVMVVILGMLQLVVPALLSRVAGRRWPARSVLPRSAFAGYWLAFVVLLAGVALISGVAIARDNCWVGITSDVFCDTLKEAQATRLQAWSDLSNILLVGTPLGVAVAALAEWSARRGP